MKKILPAGIYFMIYFSSCESKKALPTPLDLCDKISFSKNVMPIISKHCAVSGCHVTGFLPGDFTTYEGVHAQIESGFFQAKVFGERSMPPSDSLDVGELITLQCWVDHGAQNN